MKTNATIVKIVSMLTILLVLFCTEGSSQNNLKNELKQIEDMPYFTERQGNCPDSVYWDIVKRGLDVIPDLINCITSTDSTQIPIPNWGGYYTIGDIAFSIICDIIHGMPLQELYSKGKVAADNRANMVYHSFVSSFKSNRRVLKHQMKKWYKIHKADLIWTIDDSKWYPSKDCEYIISRHPAGGYYKFNPIE